MRLARFTHDGSTRVGIVVGDEIADFGPGDDVVALLADGMPSPDGRPRVPLEAVKVEAPIARPPKFLAIGLNYADHIEETGAQRPAFPVFFNKQSTCVVGPGDPVHVPRASSMVDFEGELGVVIGRRARHVPAERAHEVVAGYVVVDDVSVRDWQSWAPTMTIGKSFDTHGPIGPWLVTTDEIGDPHALSIRTWVSGELMQDGSTKEMLFDVWQQIETLSTSFTLEPGDVIATGTPAGVGIARTPARMLVPGDVVRVEIEGIGVLENPVIAEPDDTATPL